MMRQENHGDEFSDLRESQDEMESLVLDEPPSSSNGQSSPSSSSSAAAPPSAVIDRQTSASQHFNSILEPPSYADAIFTSFDSSASASNGHDSPRPESDPPARSEFLKVWVSDPQKELELSNSLVPGGTSYYTYLITTRTNMPEYGGDGSEFTVRRRFKDVVTLSDRLSESYRGFFIPIRPDKSVVESQVMQIEQFVEQRRAALSKYLNKLTAHPTIKRSEELRVFLVVKGKLPLMRSVDVASRMLDGAVRLPRLFVGEAVDANEEAQPAKGGRDLMRIFREFRPPSSFTVLGDRSVSLCFECFGPLSDCCRSFGSAIALFLQSFPQLFVLSSLEKKGNMGNKYKRASENIKKLERGCRL